MGKAAVAMTFFIIAPFVVMSAIALPHLNPQNWVVCDLNSVQWGTFINVMFWCVPPSVQLTCCPASCQTNLSKSLHFAASCAYKPGDTAHLAVTDMPCEGKLVMDAASTT